MYIFYRDEFPELFAPRRSDPRSTKTKKAKAKCLKVTIKVVMFYEMFELFKLILLSGSEECYHLRHLQFTK